MLFSIPICHSLTAFCQSYIKTTIENDQKRFQPRPVENPYLKDFEPGSNHDVGAMDTRGEGLGNAAVGSATGGSMSRAADAMASFLDSF